MRRLAILSVLQVVLAVSAQPLAQAQESRGRYIVVLKRGSNPDAKAKEHGRKYGVTKHAVYHHAIDGYSGSIPESRVDDLRSDPDVTSVFPDLDAHAAAQTTPTGVQRIRAPTTLNKGTGVNVAVLDTGIDLDHPDLAAIDGTNCVSPGSSSNDDSIGQAAGHGTHVAGIIAALDNSIGVRGVVPEAKLWAVKILDANGDGSFSDIVCGLDFVDSNSPPHGGPITVANMSLEAAVPNADDGNCGVTNGDPIHQSICQLVTDGVTVVVAAGNHHVDVKNVVPAAYDEVITVSSLSDSDGAPCGLGPPASFGVDDTFSDFSSYATTTADKAHMIGAPGDGIYSTINTGGYDYDSGTSMASPHVAGAAALYIAEHPGSTPAAVRAGLLSAGEAPGVDFNGECVSGVSHTDPSLKHPENVVAVVPAIFVIKPQTSAAAPIGVVFEGAIDGLDDSNLVLRLASGGPDITAPVSYNATTHEATLTPASPLVPGQYYTITVSPPGSTPPTDSNGDPLPETTQGFRGSLLEQETSVWAPYYWRAISTSSAYGSRLVMDRTAGAWVKFTFTGSSIAWYTMRGPDQGQGRVEVDGVVKGTYDNYRSTAQYRVKHSWGLGSGTHTIRIVALGKKNSHASNYYASVDAFGVGSTLYTNPTLTTSWRAQVMTIASGDRLVQDSSGGANVYFHFRGTGIDWRTLLGPDQGMAKVYIDGSYKGLFDNFGATTRAYTRAFRGLSDAVHDFRVVVAGTKRSSSTNTTVSVDYWRVV